MSGALSVLSARRDLVVVALVVGAILMMILPLPIWLVDVLIAANLGAAILLLTLSLSVRDPLSFSTLPAIILIATVFRLALSITTTRLILLQADAGRIVEAFGRVVVAGEVIVGLVVFLIITVVQFVVITRGAERVAEVSARFALDALPGQQQAIDAERAAGGIDGKGASGRRATLRRESQYLGAMDGAMKFVKGDAIAGLVIVFVNLVGGIALGVFRQGMPVAEAAGTYSILTVGDGLAAQIPALLVALAAGSVVTRVAGESPGTLGGDISRELGASPPALMVAGLILGALAFAPGFPAVVFAGLGLGLIGAGLWLALRRPDAPLTLRHGGGSLDAADGRALAKDGLRLVRDNGLSAGILRFEAGGVPQGNLVLPPGRLAIAENVENLALLGVEATGTGLPGLSWIPEGALPLLSACGYERVATRELVRAALPELQEPDVPDTLVDVLGEGRAVEVVRRLRNERVPFARDPARLASAVTRHAPRDAEAGLAADYTRLAFAEETCASLVDGEGRLPVIVLSEPAAAAIREGVRRTDGGAWLTVEPEVRAGLLRGVREALRRPLGGGASPALVAPLDVRRFVRVLLEKDGIDLPVLAPQEIASGVVTLPLSTVYIAAA